MGRKPHISQYISEIARNTVQTADSALELRKAQLLICA
jgi:hypothetical protein